MLPSRQISTSQLEKDKRSRKRKNENSPITPVRKKRKTGTYQSNKQGIQKNDQPLTLDARVDQFKLSLSAKRTAQQRELIRSTWNQDKELRDYFKGTKVNGQRIDNNKLIEHFKAVLSSNEQETIKSMWNGNNRLQRLVKAQKPHQARKLLHQVMSSNTNGISYFIKYLYLPAINDSEVISTVLEDIKKHIDYKKRTRYRDNQINALQARLQKLSGPAATNTDIPAVPENKAMKFHYENLGLRQDEELMLPSSTDQCWPGFDKHHGFYQEVPPPVVPDFADGPDGFLPDEWTSPGEATTNKPDLPDSGLNEEPDRVDVIEKYLTLDALYRKENPEQKDTGQHANSCETTQSSFAFFYNNSVQSNAQPVNHDNKKGWNSISKKPNQ